MISRATPIRQAGIGVLAVLETSRTVISTGTIGEEKKKNMKRRIFVCIAGRLS